MSTDQTITDVNDLAKEASTALVEMTKTPKQEIKNDEAFRLAQLVFTKSRAMTSDYRNTLRQTQSLVSGSMAFAYSKALDDVVKLLMKESTNEKTV